MEDSSRNDGFGNDETQSQLGAATQFLVLNESDQDMFETSEDCALSITEEKKLCSQVLTITDSSQTPENLDIASKDPSVDNEEQSVVEVPDSQIAVAGTKVTEQAAEELQSVLILTDTSENLTGDVEPLYTKRKYDDDSGLCSLWKIQRSDNELSTSKDSMSVEIVETSNLSRPATSLSNVQMSVRSSPRAVKRSNSCSIKCYDDNNIIKTKPRIRRFASADQPSATVSPLKSAKITKDDQNVNLKRFRINTDQILEEATSQNSSQNESQHFQLQLSPFGYSQDDSKEFEEPISRLRHMTSSEPLASLDKDQLLVSKTDQAHSVGYNYSDESRRNSQVKLKKSAIMSVTPPPEPASDQDSTISVDSSVDEPNALTSKMMSHLSNGYSSTPENVLPGLIIPQQSSNSNDNPNAGNPGADNLLLNAAKNKLLTVSSSTTPSTISPLTNGHSSGLIPINTPSLPVFDLQVGHDDNGDFMSLLIVRTDIDSGVDMCKELQRVSRRFTMDQYFADVSKSTSPSSVISSVLPYNRTSFMSTTSSSSSGSSSRTTDGAFIIPQPPKKSLSSQGPISVTGYKALIQKVNEMLVHLAENNGADISNNSLNQDDKHPSSTTTPSGVSGDSVPAESSNQRNGSATTEEIAHRATPKSSLKKLRAKGRRPLNAKTKRAILPSTNEEPYGEEMHSPEMVPTDIEKLKLSSSPVYDELYLKESSLTLKSVSRLQGKKKQEPLSTPRPKTPLQESMSKSDETTYCEGTVVLAKWVDRRYYSGKIAQVLDTNKYLIHFDDGHSKTLLDDFIIFGNMKELPILGQSVYALIDEDQNYEPGLVLAIDENEYGTVCYRCTTDRDVTVSIAASEMHLTEDQARLIKESCQPKSPQSTPTTPRRRGNRELDLENIIQGPRSARLREKPSYTPISRKGKNIIGSPEASTSGIKRNTAVSTDVSRKQRQVSESSELSEGSTAGGSTVGVFGAPGGPRIDPHLEEVAGVEPEIQKTPRKIDGMKAGPLHLKGAAKQNLGKKNSKVMKLESDDTISTLGPIPQQGSTLFTGLCFLLTCTDPPRPRNKIDKDCGSGNETDYSQYDSCTDHEDFEFASSTPFMKERIKEQIETGGGVVYSHFEDVPKKKYNTCKLITPRPCLTAKYIQCLAANVVAVTHIWVIRCCMQNKIVEYLEDELPSGWSIEKDYFIRWGLSSDNRARRSAQPFKDKLILLCSDNETFTLFWDRVCLLAGAETRIISEDNLNLSGGYAVVTESDCSHQVQNKAVQDNLPLLSTTWVVQCLIEGRLCSPIGHPKYLFSYTDAE